MDSTLREPLPYASVYILRTKQGNTTNEAGSFDFSTSCTPQDTLVVSYLGYYQKVFLVEDFLSTKCPTIYLRYQNIQEESIVITEYLTDGISLGENGTATLLRPLRISSLPGQIEPDILRSIQFLPGVSSPTGAASNICIRGGSPDQNLVLWEEMPIYHTAHYFGMMSAFNPYHIDQMKVYRGGFGAEYGGRISGVIDMKSSDYTDPNTKLGIGVNFLHAHTEGKVSLFKEKASVSYSLRRSISELWHSPTFDNITLRNQQGELLDYFPSSGIPANIHIADQFHFLDAHLKASAQISTRDNVSVAWFYGENAFDNLIDNTQREKMQQDVLALNTQGASASWTHQWQEGITSKVTGLSTNYLYDYTYNIQKAAMNRRDKFGIKNNYVRELQLHVSTQFRLKDSHQLNTGYHFHRL